MELDKSNSFCKQEPSRMSKLYKQYKPDDKETNDEYKLSKKLCSLALDVIGKDRFRNWENATNYVSRNTKFESDRFYKQVAFRSGTDVLVDFEIDIIEFILENGGTDGYFSYYYENYNKNVQDISSIIKKILNFGKIGYCQWNENIEFYQFKDFVESLNLGYLSIKYERDNPYFSIYLRPRVGTVLTSSRSDFSYAFSEFEQIGIHVSSNGLYATGYKSIEEIEWSLEDFSIFDNRDIHSIYYHWDTKLDAMHDDEEDY